MASGSWAASASAAEAGVSAVAGGVASARPAPGQPLAIRAVSGASAVVTGMAIGPVAGAWPGDGRLESTQQGVDDVQPGTPRLPHPADEHPEQERQKDDE